jgi:hypothetical protein
MAQAQERVARLTIPIERIFMTAALFAAVWLLIACTALRGEATDVDYSRVDREGLREPVYRVSKTVKANVPIDALAGPEAAVLPDEKPHPLDPALEMARKSLEHIEQNVQDYTCTLVKRERVQGELLDYEFMHCKVRHEQMEAGQTVAPFGVYLSFLKPDSVKGREVIYVEGANSGKMIAHEGGFKGRFIPTVSLLPTSAIALRGNRYPITEIGIKTLTERLIEKGSRDRRLGDCEVRLVDGAKVKDRVCTMLEVKHLDRRPEYEFCVARIFLDNELNMPIRYEAYDWPRSPEGPPELIEEYTYINVRLNVGLSDADFSAENPNYRF